MLTVSAIIVRRMLSTDTMEYTELIADPNPA